MVLKAVYGVAGFVTQMRDFLAVTNWMLNLGLTGAEGPPGTFTAPGVGGITVQYPARLYSPVLVPTVIPQFSLMAQCFFLILKSEGNPGFWQHSSIYIHYSIFQIQ